MNKLIILSIFLLISAIATAQDKPRLPTRILQTTEWNWDSAITRTFTLVYINEAGVSSHLWMMTNKGKTLYLDSIASANSFFERSDTIIVANKVFIATPASKVVNDTLRLWGHPIWNYFKPKTSNDE